MIDIVKSYAIQHAQHLCRLWCAQSFRNHGTHRPVLALQYCFVGFPRRFGQLAFLGPWEEVAALQHEGAALAAFEPAPHGVLPVRRMQGHFPDVVATGAWAPGRLFSRHAFDGLFEIWPMPGFLFMGLVQ